MRKRKNREVGKKLMSSILALTMAMGFTPGIGLHRVNQWMKN